MITRGTRKTFTEELEIEAPTEDRSAIVTTLHDMER